MTAAIAAVWLGAALLVVWLASSATPRTAPESTTAAARDLSGLRAGTSALTPSPEPLSLDPRIGREGLIAHTGSSGRYLAIPLGPGVRVRICGPGGCIDATSTDAGPAREMLLAGRIADLDIPRWEAISGVSARYGLTQGSWMVITGPQMTLPPTDVP